MGSSDEISILHNIQKIKIAEAYPVCLGFLNTTTAIDFCI